VVDEEEFLQLLKEDC